MNVRKAIAYALDKDALYEGVLVDNGTYAKNGLPFPLLCMVQNRIPGILMRETAVDEKNDLDQAKNYLAKSEYPDGFECDLYINQDSIYNSIAIYVQEALSQIGITVNIEQKSGDEMSNIQFGSTRDYDMAIVRVDRRLSGCKRTAVPTVPFRQHCREEEEIPAVTVMKR